METIGHRTVSREFPRLAPQAGAKPPPGAYVHADPPVKPLQHAQRARGAKVARGRRMTSLHDPRAHEQRDVDANRLVVQQASRADWAHSQLGNPASPWTTFPVSYRHNNRCPVLLLQGVTYYYNTAAECIGIAFNILKSSVIS